MSTRPLLASILGLLLICVLAVPVSAQTTDRPNVPSPKNSLTLGGGIGLVSGRTSGIAGGSIPSGWLVSFGATINGKVAGIGEVSRGVHDGRTLHTLMWGARFFMATPSRFTPFAQLMAGSGRGTAAGSNTFALQPGGGVDIGFGPLALRVQGDVAWFRNAPSVTRGFRLATSIVIR